ncbi:Hypothetical predicted protein [Octopus vulgaris]|uniref:Uncharacterized protein n=1 Tax=Octopus vulgaris TaxID=6645 RepID=A0AA36B4J8_OCTVU|nr:Hypothetical predicted protein [Octopus vulgaris]
MHYCIGNLLSTVNRKPVYTQLYYVDTENVTRNRLSFKRADNDLNENILVDLKRVLIMHNPYVKSFKHTIDIIKEYSAPGKCSTIDIIMSHVNRLIPARSHLRTYKPPAASEIAVIVVGEDTNIPSIKPADGAMQNKESNGRGWCCCLSKLVGVDTDRFDVAYRRNIICLGDTITFRPFDIHILS